jgi:aromatic-L-amino-acid decarboxylase
MELPSNQREQSAHAALEWVLRYFDEQSRRPIYPITNSRDLTSLLASELPLDPQGLTAVMGDFEDIAVNSRHNGHPRMFGYVQSSSSFAGVAADPRTAMRRRRRCR